MPLAAVRLLAAEGEEKGRELPVDPLFIGVGAFALLVILLAVTMLFGKDR